MNARAGDVSDEMFFVVKGKVQMFRSESSTAGPRGPNQHQLSVVLVGVFSQGMDLELDSVLNCTPMVASYVAATTCDLVWLDQADLWNVLAKNQDATVALQARAKAQRAQLEHVLSLPQRQAPELFIAMKERIIVDDEVIEVQAQLMGEDR